MIRLMVALSLFFTVNAFGLNMELDFGVIPPKSTKPGNSNLPLCSEVEDFAPGVENINCLGSYGFKTVSRELFWKLLLSQTEEEIRDLIEGNEVLEGGAAILVFCRDGLLDPDLIACGIDYNF